MAFALCSMTAALGGLLMTARLNAAEAAMGDAYGLQTVAAVVIEAHPCWAEKEE